MDKIPLDELGEHVEMFFFISGLFDEKRFLLTPIGCGIAGFKPEEIAPLFNRFVTKDNVALPMEFWDVLI